MADPSRIPHYLKSNLIMTSRYIREGKFGHLLGSFSGGVSGWNAYVATLRQFLPNDNIIIEIHGNEMIISLSDPGISRELLMYGTREHYSAKVLRDELREMKSEVDGPLTVLELGANIGYYVLQEANILSNEGEIHAFEPAPGNFKQLQRNVGLNGFDNVTEQNMAVGSESSDIHLKLSESSNQHKVVPEADEDTVTIPGTTVEEYLEQQEVNAADVNLIRMDVQGHETEIYKGMRDVLKEAGPLLLFIEFHAHLNEEDLDEMIADLQANNFEIVSALTASGAQTWYEYEADIDSLGDLQGISDSVEMILRKK